MDIYPNLLIKRLNIRLYGKNCQHFVLLWHILNYEMRLASVSIATVTTPWSSIIGLNPILLILLSCGGVFVIENEFLTEQIDAHLGTGCEITRQDFFGQGSLDLGLYCSF